MRKLQNLFEETCECGATYDQHKSNRLGGWKRCPNQYGSFKPDARTEAMQKVQADVEAKARRTEYIKWAEFYSNIVKALPGEK